MIAWFSGCVARPVAAEDGVLRWEQILPEIRPLGPHWAPTGLISLENSHNMRGGAVTPKEVIDPICDNAHEMGLKVHLDGARIFNAATYLGIPVHELCDKLDTVMFCLSKGLGAPQVRWWSAAPQQSNAPASTASGLEAACGRQECWPPRA